MMQQNSQLRRWSTLLPWGAMAVAGLLQLWLLMVGIKAQLLRLFLWSRHGLGPPDGFCTTGFCDHAGFWVAGNLVRHGQAGALYIPARFAALAAHLLPYKTGWWPFVYPPTALPLFALISWVPLAPGYYLAGGLMLLAAILVLRGAGVPGWAIALGCLSPAAMWNFYLGQLGFLAGAVLVFGLSRLARAPLQAGLVLGLLAVKPPYALLVPVAVLAARSGRAVAGGALTLAALLALSWWVGGADLWRDYWGPGRAAMRALLDTPPGGAMPMGISMFWALRSLGAGVGVAYAGQGAITLAALALTARLWRRPAGMHRLTATLALTLLASPYGFTDDFSTLSVVLPLLARRGAPWRNAVLAWVYVMPAFLPLVAARWHVALGPGLLALLLFVCVRRLSIWFYSTTIGPLL